MYKLKKEQELGQLYCHLWQILLNISLLLEVEVEARADKVVVEVALVDCLLEQRV
jgi:hypothetical protein